MKRIFILILAAGLCTNLHAQVSVDVSYQTFYDQLSPYGHWVSYPGYGYVWHPSAEAGFRPYGTAGHWAWTDEGWCWVSDYSWGWAAFHYGRWFYDSDGGWMWVPGYDWSPAWVAWRSGGGCYGWAPVSPGFDVSVGFGAYAAPSNYWCFAPQRYMVSANLGNYCYASSRNATYIHNTTIISSGHGPAVADVQRVTHRTIVASHIRAASGPGRAVAGRGEVSIYRPAVNHSTAATAAPHSVREFHGTPRPSLPRGESRTPAEYAGVAAHAHSAAPAAHHEAASAHEARPAVTHTATTHHEAAPAVHHAAAPAHEARPAVTHTPTHAAPVHHEAAPTHEARPAVTHTPTHTAPTHAAPTHTAPAHTAPAHEARPAVTHAPTRSAAPPRVAPRPAPKAAPPVAHAEPEHHS